MKQKEKTVPALKPQRLQLGLQGWQAQSTAMQIMTAVGFEPTQLALVELESTPLDHSGKLSLEINSEISSNWPAHSKAPTKCAALLTKLAECPTVLTKGGPWQKAFSPNWHVWQIRPGVNEKPASAHPAENKPSPIFISRVPLTIALQPGGCKHAGSICFRFL